MTKYFKKSLLLLVFTCIYPAKIFFDLGSVVINEYNPSLWTSIANSSNPIEGYFDYAYHIFKPFSDEINYKRFLIDNFGIEPISQRAKIIFYDLQIGDYNSEQIVKLLTEKIKNSSIETEKKEYLQKLVNNILFENTLNRIKLFDDVPEVMKLLNKHQHQYYVLSNWSNGFRNYFFNNFDDFLNLSLKKIL